MSIQGHREVAKHHEPPLPTGYTVQIVVFHPSRKAVQHEVVSSIASLRRILAPYREQVELVVYLDRDGGNRGSVWVHFNGRRAWVTHFRGVGGTDSYCFDSQWRHDDDLLEFTLSNGQVDEIHRCWTITRGRGFRALEYFVRHGKRHPKLKWRSPSESLQEPK